MKSSKCIICDGECYESVPYLLNDSNNHSELMFNTIKLCSICGFGMAFPRPSQEALDEYYSAGDYWHSTISENIFQEAHEKSQAFWRIQQCKELISAASNISVLDVGAGHGVIGEVLADHISRYDRVEPDAQLAAAFNLQEHNFSSDHFQHLNDVGSQKYDLIFANHVLEHVIDPESFLEQLVSHLNPEGIVYIEVPFADWKFKRDIFPHTLFFTPDAISELGDGMRLNTLKAESFGISRDAYFNQNRWLSRLFAFSVRFRIHFLTRWVDGCLWKYQAKNPSGIWLRWIFKK